MSDTKQTSSKRLNLYLRNTKYSDRGNPTIKFTECTERRQLNIKTKKLSINLNLSELPAEFYNKSSSKQKRICYLLSRSSIQIFEISGDNFIDRMLFPTKLNKIDREFLKRKAVFGRPRGNSSYSSIYASYITNFSGNVGIDIERTYSEGKPEIDIKFIKRFVSRVLPHYEERNLRSTIIRSTCSYDSALKIWCSKESAFKVLSRYFQNLCFPTQIRITDVFQTRKFSLFLARHSFGYVFSFQINALPDLLLSVSAKLR